MSHAVLVINAGSSSIKLSLYRTESAGEPLLAIKGQVEGIGSAPHFRAKNAQGRSLVDRKWSPAEMPDHKRCFDFLNDWLPDQLDGARLIAAGHRVVHGGPELSAPVVVDSGVLARLQELVPLAPLHQPHNLSPIRALLEANPELPQVACFDTAFHRGQAKVAESFALPREYYDAGVRRYGFHGLSYEYIAQRLPTVAPDIAQGRVVVAHLGNGASMCALKDGRSLASTMGFTALDGLMMGTRCGNIDPGVLLYLMEVRGMTEPEISDLLYHKSGLLGVSGVSNDMRELLASDRPACAEAVDLFVYRACRELGGLVAALGGLDGLVFTAGIGEHAAEVRARICRQSAWLGFELDEAANAAQGPCITREHSPLPAWVIPTDEELMIARHTLDLVGGGSVTSAA